MDALHTTHNVSAAQHCNEDVLLHIFRYPSRRGDLAVAARVCRAWLYPARSMLYGRITCNFNSFTVSLLDQTLSTCEHLRTLIRHLRVQCDWPQPTFDSNFSWIAHLPAQKLRSIEFMFFRNIECPNIIFASPAVSAVQKAVIRSRSTSKMLDAVLHMPQLTSLSLTVSNSTGDRCVIERNLKLRRLTIAAMALDLPDLVFNIVNAIDPACTLERFDLIASATISAANVPVLLGALERHLPNLKHLCLGSLSQFCGPKEPFMDDLVKHLPSVQTLYCGYGTYTTALITRLPPTLHTLGLIWGSQESILTTGTFSWAEIDWSLARHNVRFPCEDYAAAITRLGADGGGCGLQKLVLVRSGLVQDDYTALEQACRAARINFEVAGMIGCYTILMD